MANALLRQTTFLLRCLATKQGDLFSKHVSLQRAFAAAKLETKLRN